MVSRWIESALIHAVNRARDRHGSSLRPTHAVGDLPAGYVLVGHTIPTRSYERTAPETITLSAEARRRHLYVLGATGTGKTNLLMRFLESDIAARRSFCVVDLRGDLVDRILLRLAEADDPDMLAKRLLLLDLRDEQFSVGFNPLQGSGDVYSRAFHLLSVIRQQAESWGIQLEETLRNGLIALSQSGWSLLEMEPLLSNAAFRASVMAQVSDRYVVSFFQKYDQLSEEKQMAWRLPVLNKITPLLAIPSLRRLFGQRNAFSLRERLDKEPGSILLVSLAVDRLHHAAYLVGGLFVSAFQSAIMARADTPENQRVPVHLYVDEFETMATEQFEAIVAEGRRFGLGLCLSHQNLSQVPSRLRDVLLNNVHTQFYFQTGATDAAGLAREIAGKEPREEVQKRLITQGVGEAYLIRRGQPSVRVKVLPCPDTKVGAAKVHAIRQASNMLHARPVAEVEQELLQRAVQWETPPPELPSAKPAVKPTAAVAAPTYEIRHDKKSGQFKPKK